MGLVILRHDESKSLYVIFRGTADVKDVISDININGVTPYPDRSLGVLVFSGAWNHLCARALEDIVPAIRNAVERGVDKIIFTGHSLGGACAKLGLFYMQTAAHGVELPAGTRMRAITFGAPMVFYPKPHAGGEEWSALAARLEPHILTFVNQKVSPAFRRVCSYAGSVHACFQTWGARTHTPFFYEKNRLPSVNVSGPVPLYRCSLYLCMNEPLCRCRLYLYMNVPLYK